MRLGPHSIALRDHRADHQLDLVEQHQRYDEGTDYRGREQDPGHGHAGGQTLLGAAEDDGYLVFSREAQRARSRRRDGEDDG